MFYYANIVGKNIFVLIFCYKCPYTVQLYHTNAQISDERQAPGCQVLCPSDILCPCHLSHPLATTIISYWLQPSWKKLHISPLIFTCCPQTSLHIISGQCPLLPTETSEDRRVSRDPHWLSGICKKSGLYDSPHLGLSAQWRGRLHLPLPPTRAEDTQA